MTGLPVEHRFENHKTGYKSAWTVKKHGIRLMPELYEHLNPMPFEAAAQMEKDLIPQRLPGIRLNADETGAGLDFVDQASVVIAHVIDSATDRSRN